ncbi:hypothetical protein Aduo_012072 [Ancylostoma duodenale]
MMGEFHFICGELESGEMLFTFLKLAALVLTWPIMADGGGLSDPGESKPETDGASENIGGEAEQIDTDQSPEDAVVTIEISTMQEYMKKGGFRPDEINARITPDRLKDENGQQYFTSGRFGAVFLLPGSTVPQKPDVVKDLDDAPSQSG